MRKLGGLAALLLLFPTASLAGTADPLAPERSSGMDLVAGISSTGGTDLEFFSRTLSSYKDATGTMIVPEAPVERHFAMVGNQTTGAKIVDITDPTTPYIAAAIRNCSVGQGDIQIGKDALVAAIAYQTSGSCKSYRGKTLPKGSILVDLADVYNPLVVAVAAEPLGSHNQTIHPSGEYLYISTSGKTPGAVPVYDISDPYAPTLVQKWTAALGDSPHDIRFSEDGTRAYMAGIDQFRVVDTTDPANPVEISRIVAPGSTIGHDAVITPDNRFLFLGDEANGGGTFPCPGGAIYAYDLANEASPVLLGVAEAGVGPVSGRTLDDPNDLSTGLGGCTSHVMDLNPDKRSITLGWYIAGSRIFDFSSFYNADGTPKSSVAISAAWGKYGVGLVEKAWIIPEDARTWSAKQYDRLPCYVFSDDLALGFYVSKISGCTPSAAPTS